MRIIFLFIFLTAASHAFAQNREIPYTQEDRDRSIRMEEKLNSQQQQINDIKQQITDLKESTQKQITDLKESTQKQITGLKESTQLQITGLQQQITGLQQQITDLKNLFYWGFGILITFMMFLLGFIIWDRRTAMEPLRQSVQAFAEQSKTFLAVLREFARDQPRLQELLKTHGLL